MNENIDLTKILKDCPKGWKFYSNIYDEVIFWELLDFVYPIHIDTKNHGAILLSEKGEKNIGDGKCVLFPSKEQRDWSKFTAPWYKKEKFDPKTLKPFDKVLVRDATCCEWNCDFFSHICNDCGNYPYITISAGFKYCVPYNDDTKYLVGTTDEAPEYYRYWEE